MTLTELGDILRGEREQRGITLEDVSQRLRISRHVLQSLEEGNADALPHKAYAKGFIRSYATFLGLSAEEVEACVASLGGTAPSSVPQPIAKLTEEEDEPKVPAGKMLACAVALLLLAGGGYAAWHFDLPGLVSRGVEGVKIAQPLQQLAQKKQEATPPQQGKSQQPAQAQRPAASGQGTPGSAASQPQKAAKPDTAAPGRGQQPGQKTQGQTPVVAAQPQTGSQAGTQTQPQNLYQPQPQASAPAAPATPASHHKIIVTAIEDCWIHSTADQSNTRQFTLRKGDTFALTFTKSLKVKLGNAAGVRIRYNGNDLPLAGKPGETRTMVFPPSENQ